MKDRCHCCLLMLWVRAIRAILDNTGVIEDILVQRKRNPHEVSDKQFLKECAWAIYNSWTSFKSVKGKWDQIEQAFLGWDYQQISQNVNSVRQAAPPVRNSTRKVDAVISIARRMTQIGWTTIRKQLLSGLRQDTRGNFVPDPELIKYLDRLPMIGETNAIYILKNLGYDVAKPDKQLKKLVAKFGYPPDTSGVQQFASDISELVLECISVVDTVLWTACSAGSDLSCKGPRCGRQR